MSELWDKRVFADRECDDCGGLGVKFLENGSAFRCDCHKRMRVPSVAKLAGIPNRFADVSLKSYLPETLREKNSLKSVVEWVKEFDFGNDGLFLTGPKGTGKTHLLCATVMNLIRSKDTIQPMYIPSAELMRKIKSEFNSENDGDTLDKAKRVSVLAIDDLGTEYDSPHDVRVMAEIIDARYSQNKTTLISSNLDLARIAKRYDERLADRITEMCRVLVFDGATRRDRKAA